MGIKNSKQSVNISTIPKKDAKKSEVAEKGDLSEKADDDNLKVESIKNLTEEVSAGEKEESSPKAEEVSNGQVVPVLKVEDVEVAGVGEEGDKEVPKMSKIASMKRDLSFGRLQKMFSREAKSEPPQQDAVTKEDAESSPEAELSATDEKQVKAEEAMGEEVKSEEDIESRVTGLKRSLMKMFTSRESESEAGATSTAAATAIENEGDEEKKGEEEGSPTKMSSLKKRLSFKAMKSKFSKEKKEANAGEENNEEKKETEKEEKEEKIDDEETEEGEEKRVVEEEQEAAATETKQEVEAPADADAKVNQDEAKAETTSPTVVASVLPEELQQSGADADKQPEDVAQELLVGEGSRTELETESSKKEE